VAELRAARGIVPGPTRGFAGIREPNAGSRPRPAGLGTLLEGQRPRRKEGRREGGKDAGAERQPGEPG